MIAYLPPLVIDVAVRKEERQNFRIWFPFVLLWPLLLILVSFTLLVTALVDFALLLSGARYHHYTLLVLAALRVLGETRGTHINAIDNDNHIFVDIY
jgi:hypothetical protein